MLSTRPKTNHLFNFYHRYGGAINEADRSPATLVKQNILKRLSKIVTRYFSLVELFKVRDIGLEAIKVLEANYPEVIRKAFIINGKFH